MANSHRSIGEVGFPLPRGEIDHVPGGMATRCWAVRLSGGLGISDVAERDGIGFLRLREQKARYRLGIHLGCRGHPFVCLRCGP